MKNINLEAAFMTAQELNDSTIHSDIILVNSGWEFRLARWISLVGSPPVLFASMILWAAVLVDALWQETAVYLILTLALPLAYIVYLVQQGKATDLDVSVRQQRIIPMFVSLAGAAVGWLYFEAILSPQLLTLLATAHVITSLIIAIITIFWKISVHSITSASTAVFLWAMTGSPMVFLIIPMIIWSRVYLRRHSLLQTIAGGMLGIVVMGTLFFTYGV
jgi:membrane-associated phospholipid phosphatase